MLETPPGIGITQCEWAISNISSMRGRQVYAWEIMGIDICIMPLGGLASYA